MAKTQKNDELVKEALKVANEFNDTKTKHDSELQDIQDLFEEGFEIHDPSGNKKIYSKTLQQALWKVVNKMKFLDFTIHGTNRPWYMEKIVTDGVNTIADKGGMIRSLRDKNGTFFQAALYGDGFMHIGTDKNKKNICFS